MIKANDKFYDWHKNMTVFNVFTTMGYTLKKPSVLVKLNNEVISRTKWDTLEIPDNSVITIVNLLRGG